MPEQTNYKCMRCGHEWRGDFDVETIERMCPRCRSNSVRRFKDKAAKAPVKSQSNT